MASTSAGTWFERVTWVGIAANLALAIPTLLVPEQIFGLFGFTSPVPLVWVRFASLLLILVSAFYVPAALDVDRNRTNAWLSVLARLAGTLFFLTQPREYWMLAAFDFVFFLPEVILLSVAANRS
jgi:hypothetical protein